MWLLAHLHRGSATQRSGAPTLFADTWVLNDWSWVEVVHFFYRQSAFK